MKLPGPREYVDVVRMALARETVRYEGTHITLPRPDGPGKATHVRELPRDADTVGCIAGFKFRIQPMGRLEVGQAQSATVALEPVAKRGEHAMGVEPAGEVGEDLVLDLVAEETFQLGPRIGLRFAEERDDLGGKEGAFGVVHLPLNGAIAMSQEVLFDGCLEGCFSARLSHFLYTFPP